MKIEDAIEHFRQCDTVKFILTGVGETEFKTIEFKEFVEALDKQIPKQPANKVHEKYPTLGRNYYCTCGVMFVDFERNGTNYCGNCGQRLK